MSRQLYSTEELQQMNPMEFAEARRHDFVKFTEAELGRLNVEAAVEKPLSPEEARSQERIGKTIFGEGYTNPSQPPTPQDPYAVTSWGSPYYDFVVPSGQKCQMKKLDPAELVSTGLLDKITRLPGFSEEAVRKAEGQPPKPVNASGMPSEEDMQLVISLLEELIPLVVNQPKVMPSSTPREEQPAGSVLVSDIDLMDRIAIMNRATQGVAKMDNFRKES